MQIALPDAAEPGTEDDVRLSKAEVEEWLALFGGEPTLGRKRKRKPRPAARPTASPNGKPPKPKSKPQADDRGAAQRARKPKAKPKRSDGKRNG
jgi:hypothetical protein